MATNVIYDYGPAVGPSSYNTFSAFVGIRIAETSATAYRLEYNHAIWVGGTNPNFGGTVLDYGYWLNGSEVGSGKVSLYGGGWYADTGWINGGWYSSGQTMSIGCYGQYTSGSAGFLKSNIDRSYTVPQLQTVPNNVTNLKAVRNSDNQITVTWTNNPTSNGPYSGVYLDKETNDSGWPNLSSSNINSYIDKAVTSNSRYRYRALAYNGVGTANNGNHLYSTYVYTTPPAPANVIAIKTGNTVSLQADVSNINYPKQYQWQRASSNTFSDATTLTGTGSNLTDSTTLSNPWYRVRCLSLDGSTYSAWKTCQASSTPQLFVNVPTGSSIKEIYIWK